VVQGGKLITESITDINIVPYELSYATSLDMPTIKELENNNHRNTRNNLQMLSVMLKAFSTTWPIIP
jgi:hypothetical protein